MGRSPEPEYAVQVDNLSYSVNDTGILRGISLKVVKGEFLGLIGPNGAGKTTLLKCLNGINRTEADGSGGKIFISGEDIRNMNNRRIARMISLMHQNTQIDFPFKVADIVLMGRYPHIGRFRNESRHDHETARKYMEYTDILHLEHRLITGISGGERQRVFFAKVLAQETPVILLDEPTASLDISHQEQIFKYSKGICRSGKTVIAAVHDLKIAARYCSKLALMKNGVIMAQGAPDEVLTAGNLSEAYGVNALVYRNRVTGQIDFYIHEPGSEAKKHTVHVIGGGGSSSGVLRMLFESGYRITAGVFSPADSDLQAADVFGAESVVCKPFSDICDETYAKNVELIEKADMTILCNMPFGRQNLRNLEAADRAERLVIIEDDVPGIRDFSGGTALDIYAGLRKRALITTSARLHEVL